MDTRGWPSDPIIFLENIIYKNMLPSKEYLEQISKKLDSFNKINGVDPGVKNDIFNDNFDPFDHMGKTALAYMERKKTEEVDRSIDPLFVDRNKY
jgi:hypothetical protein